MLWQHVVLCKWYAAKSAPDCVCVCVVWYDTHSQAPLSQPVLIWSRLNKLAPQIVRTVPEAATTVLRTPDDGRDGRPKHVE